MKLTPFVTYFFKDQCFLLFLLEPTEQVNPSHPQGVYIRCKQYASQEANLMHLEFAVIEAHPWNTWRAGSLV